MNFDNKQQMSEYVIFLETSDFKIKPSGNGLLLTQNIPNLSFVLFYTNDCPHCKTMLSILKLLPNMYKGIKFCSINVSNKINFIRQTSKTLTPLEYVPYMMVYIDGVPYVQYTGDYDASKICEFIMSVEKSVIQLKNKMSQLSMEKIKLKETKKSEKKDELSHPCTFGVPICGKNNVCYFNVCDAYDNGNQNKDNYFTQSNR